MGTYFEYCIEALPRTLRSPLSPGSTLLCDAPPFCSPHDDANSITSAKVAEPSGVDAKRADCAGHSFEQ